MGCFIGKFAHETPGQGGLTFVDAGVGQVDDGVVKKAFESILVRG